jgi:hypothetical protein
MMATRTISALVAACIAMVIAALSAQVEIVAFRALWGVRIEGSALPAYALLGVPIVAWLGWHLGPAVVHGGRRTVLARAVWMAVLAVVIGAFCVVFVTVAIELPGSQVRWPDALIALPYLLAAPIVGIVLFGPFVLLVTLPAAIAWAGLLRLAVDDPTWRAGEPIASIH